MASRGTSPVEHPFRRYFEIVANTNTGQKGAKVMRCLIQVERTNGTKERCTTGDFIVNHLAKRGAAGRSLLDLQAHHGHPRGTMVRSVRGRMRAPCQSGASSTQRVQDVPDGERLPMALPPARKLGSASNRSKCGNFGTNSASLGVRIGYGIATVVARCAQLCVGWKGRWNLANTGVRPYRNTRIYDTDTYYGPKLTRIIRTRNTRIIRTQGCNISEFW
jgi:hypothetical protein